MLVDIVYCIECLIDREPSRQRQVEYTKPSSKSVILLTKSE
jgi:hypothetical protein